MIYLIMIGASRIVPQMLVRVGHESLVEEAPGHPGLIRDDDHAPARSV